MSVKFDFYSFLRKSRAYTDFGKKNFLKKGDEIFVYVYNAHAHSFQDIMNDMCGMDIYLGQCSKLHQIVK